MDINWKLNKLKIGQVENWTNWKLNKLKSWTKLKIGQKLKVEQNWKIRQMLTEEEENIFIEARSMFEMNFHIVYLLGKEKLSTL